VINVFLLSQKHEVAEAILEITEYSPKDYYKVKKDIFLSNYSFDDSLDALSFINLVIFQSLSIDIS